MKWFLGFCLGTACSAVFLGILVLANGTPLPPMGNWVAVAQYPTGSWATTMEILWIFYFASFVLVFSLAWAWRKVSRGSGSGTGVRPPTAGM